MGNCSFVAPAMRVAAQLGKVAVLVPVRLSNWHRWLLVKHGQCFLEQLHPFGQFCLQALYPLFRSVQFFAHLRESLLVVFAHGFTSPCSHPFFVVRTTRKRSHGNMRAATLIFPLASSRKKPFTSRMSMHPFLSTVTKSTV